VTGSLVVCSNTTRGQLNWAPIARCVVAHRPEVLHLLTSSARDDVTLADLPEALQRYLMTKGIRFESAFLPSAMSFCLEVRLDVLPGATFRHVEVLEAFRELKIDVSVWATRTDASGRTRLDIPSPTEVLSDVNPEESVPLLLALSGVQIDPLSDVELTLDSNWIADALHRDHRGMISIVLDSYPFDADTMSYLTPLGHVDARIGEGFWLEDVVAQGVRKFTNGTVWSSAVVSASQNEPRNLGRAMTSARKRPWRVFVAQHTGVDPAIAPQDATSSLLHHDRNLLSLPDMLVRDMRQASGRNELDIVTFGADELVVHEVKFKRPTEHDVAKLSGIVSRLAPVHRKGLLYHAYAPVNAKKRKEFKQELEDWRELFPTITVLHWAVLFGLNPHRIPSPRFTQDRPIRFEEARQNGTSAPWSIALPLLERIWEHDPFALQCYFETRFVDHDGCEASILIDHMAPSSIVQSIRTLAGAVLAEHGFATPPEVVLVRP